MGRLRPLNTEQRYWLHAKIALTTWAILLIFYTPLPVQALLGYIISGGIGLVTAGGVAISIWGLLLTRGPHLHDVVKGTRIEISGLWIAISGPFAYGLAQLFLQLAETEPIRVPQIAIFYTVCAFLAVRLAEVRGHRKKLGS